MHLVELLDDCALVEVLLDLIFCGDASGNHWVYEVLEDLPKQEGVVALCNHKVHLKVSLSIVIIELLQTSLILESDCLIDFQHHQHEFLDFLDSDYLKSFIKQFDQICRCTRIDYVSSVIDYDSIVSLDLALITSWLALSFLVWAVLSVCQRFGLNDVQNDWNKHGVNLDRVSVTKRDKTVIKRVISAAELLQGVVVLVRPVNKL